MTEFAAYIDESGDEGVGRGTRWFVLAAVIVESGKAGSNLGQRLSRIKRQIELKKPVLHWADLSHPRRLVVCDELAQEPITTCAVLVDTHHTDMQQTTLTGGRLYFYAFRWLVERVTWFCTGQSGQVRLRPENKAGISYRNLENYLSFVQKLPGCQIRPNCILDVRTCSKSQLALLQVADSVAGAVAAGFEHKYGVVEPAYLLKLQSTLYRHRGYIWGYGLKFMPYRASLVPSSLIHEYPWLRTL
jgi:hypothetical protein